MTFASLTQCFAREVQDYVESLPSRGRLDAQLECRLRSNSPNMGKIPLATILAGVRSTCTRRSWIRRMVESLDRHMVVSGNMAEIVQANTAFQVQARDPGQVPLVIPSPNSKRNIGCGIVLLTPSTSSRDLFSRHSGSWRVLSAHKFMVQAMSWIAPIMGSSIPSCLHSWLPWTRSSLPQKRNLSTKEAWVACRTVSWNCRNTLSLVFYKKNANFNFVAGLVSALAKGTVLATLSISLSVLPSFYSYQSKH
jgi:hypothetical protein